MASHFKPGPAVAMRVLSDRGALVFDERAQRLFALNAAATFVWCRLEEGAAQEDLAGELAALIRSSPEDARSTILGCLAEWERQGLIGDAAASALSDDRAALPTGSAMAIAPPLEGAATAEMFAEQEGRLAGLWFRVRYATRALATRVRPVLEHLTSPHAARPHLIVDLVGRSGAYEIFANGRGFGRCRTLPEVAPVVKHCLAVHLLEHGDYGVAFHAAGVVGPNGRCLMLAAAPGAGKTTLSAALSQRGWGFLADDTLLFDYERRRVRGVRFCLAVKEGSRAVLRALYPDLDHLPVHLRQDGQTVRYLPPPASPTANEDGHAVAWLVFPRHAPGAPHRLRPLDPRDALTCLLTEAFHPARHLTLAGFHRLTSWICRVPAFELTFPTLEDAVAAISRACR